MLHHPLPLVRLLLIVALLSAAPAVAEPLGEIAVSGGDDLLVGCVDPEPFTPLALYVLVAVDFADDGRPEENSWNGLRAWEGRLVLPASLTLMTASALPATAADADPAFENFVVTLGETLVSGGLPLPVARIWVGAFHTDPLGGAMVGLGPAPVPVLEAPGPAWREAKDGTDHSFVSAPLHLSCEAPTVSLGWGALKARFGRGQGQSR